MSSNPPNAAGSGMKNDIPAASAAKLVADLAVAASEPAILGIPIDVLGDEGLPDKIPVLWDRANNRMISVKDEAEKYRIIPQRIRGTAKVETLASFIDLTNRHKGALSAIFALTAWPKPSLSAVIDYYDSGSETDWAQHRILYEFPLTEEFKVWIGNNGKPLPQARFAAFLDEHSAELAAPMDGEIIEYERLFCERFGTPSEIVDMARHLEVNVGAKIKQKVRLQSGERQVLFETEHTNSNGDPVDIPGIFIVSVAPFIDGGRARIPARISYRVTGGDIEWSYQLYRWEFWLRERVQSDLLRAAKETGLPAFEGSPES